MFKLMGEKIIAILRKLFFYQALCCIDFRAFIIGVFCKSFNSMPASGEVCCMLMIFANSLDPYHTQQNIESKKEGKNQESIQSSTTPDPGYQWESDNVTIRHHNESQELYDSIASD